GPTRLKNAAAAAAGLNKCFPLQDKINFEALATKPASKRVNPESSVVAGDKIKKRIRLVITQDSLLLGLFHIRPIDHSTTNVETSNIVSESIIEIGLKVRRPIAERAMATMTSPASPYTTRRYIVILFKISSIVFISSPPCLVAERALMNTSVPYLL